MKIQIAKIHLDKALYPRDDLDNPTVSRYRLALDLLPPIKVWQEGKDNYILVDGYHRLVAHQIEGQKEIEANVLDIPKEEIMLEAVKLNAKHGLQLDSNEKTRLAIMLFEEYEGKITETQIAQMLSISQSTISNWLKVPKHKKDEERKIEALDKYLNYLSYPSQDSVAIDLGVTDKTISNWLRAFINSNKITDAPETLQLTTIWDFPRCDPQYGIDYPGRMPGQVVENLLWYYTNPFDIVLDPTAGGGTTLDVCRQYYRRYIGYDLNPIEAKGIRYNNALEGIPLKDSLCDFILFDPPYWNQKKYTEHKDDLSNLQIEGFLEAVEKVFVESKRLLKNGGKVAFIISGENNKEVGFLDLPFECYKLFVSYFKPIERIAVVYRGASSHDAIWTHRAKENKFMFRGFRDLLIGKK